jgi:putative endonuclease
VLLPAVARRAIIEHLSQTYVGLATDLKARLAVPVLGGATHAAKFRPWRLFRWEEAIEFERCLKTESGRAFAKKRLRQVKKKTRGVSGLAAADVAREGQSKTGA